MYGRDTADAANPHHINLTPPSTDQQILATLQRIEALLMVIADNTERPVVSSTTAKQPVNVSNKRKNK